MVAFSSALSVLVLSEDGAKDAYETVVALAKKLFRAVDEQCQTHKIGFDSPGEEIRLAARRNTWKGTDSQHDRLRVALVREIATTVAQENSHVLFHIDGDRMWAKRSSSENRSKFERLIRSKVRALLEMQLPGREAEFYDRCMARLFDVVPFYSIEAWLYQNTAAATKICTEEYQGKDADVFEGGSKDRGQLDEVECPKEKTCLSSKHNGELATTSFPAADVIAAGKSFAACLDQMRASDPLVADLAATH